MKTLFFGLMLVFASFGFGEDFSSPFGAPTYNGSGCPKNSVAVLSTEDAFTLIFSKYTAEKGPGVLAHHSYKYCNLKIPVTVPSGYRADIVSVDYRGFASLASQDRGYLYTYFNFGSYQYGSSSVSRFLGPVDDDFFKRDSGRYNRRNWCSDGRRPIPLNLSTSMWVTGSRSKKSAMTLDSVDGVVELKLVLTKCRP